MNPRKFYLNVDLPELEYRDAQEEKVTTTIEVLRVGTLFDRGMKITQEMINDMAANFVADVVGSQISVNRDHTDGEACGWLVDLRCEGDRLMATIEWTNLGVDLVRGSLYKYVSAEFYDVYPRSVDGKKTKNVFTGLALTNTPALKNQQPLKLSETNINLTFNIMLKKLCSDLLNRESITVADAKMARNLLSELPEEEQAEVEADVEAVEEKAEADEAAAEEAAAEKEAAEKEELAEKVVLKDVVAQNNKLAEQVKTLTAEAERGKVTKLAEGIIISQHKVNGLPTAKKEDAVKFMLSLDESQRQNFVSLMDSLVSYTPGTEGFDASAADKEGTSVKLSEQEVKDKINALSEKATKLAAETGRDYEECLTELTAAEYKQ